MIQFVVLEVTQMKNFAYLWEISNKCNSRCKFCHFRGVNETSLDEVKVILANIK